MSYYKDQISKINPKSDAGNTIKLFCGETGDFTKWMDINDESAQVLVDWLTQNYLTPAQTEISQSDKEKWLKFPPQGGE